MKLLVLLAVLGAVSAQYKLYTGVSPFLHHTAYTPLTYAHQPVTYAHQPVTYSAYPYSAYPYPYYGLPYAFQPAEKPVEAEKPAEAEKPVVVEARSKRSADEDQQSDEATVYTTYAAHPYTYPLTYSRPAYSHAAYSVPTVYNSHYAYNTYPYTYSGFHGYSPLVHSLKKRDTAAADQQGEDATLYTTYAAHPYTYSAGYHPFYRGYATPYAYTPASTAPLTYTAGYPYTYGSYVY